MSPADESLHAAARSALAASDGANLTRIAGELIARARASGDRRELGYGYYYLGAAFFWRSEPRQSEDAYQQALELAREAGDREAIARAMLGLAATAMHGEQAVDKARRLYEEALPLVRELGDRKLLAATLGSLGAVCQFEADYERSLNYAAESMAISEELRMPGATGVQCVNVAHVHTLRRDYASARAYLRRSYEYLRLDGSPRRMAWYVDGCFVYAAKRSQWEIAARLLGFANRYRDEHSVARLELTPWFTGHIERLSNELDEARLQALELEGEALKLEAIPETIESIG